MLYVIHSQIEVLKAALSNREYEITTECLLSNFSETPHIIPALDKGSGTSVGDVMVPEASVDPGTIASESQERETWLTMKVLVAIDLIELSLHLGRTRDSSLASVQVCLCFSCNCVIYFCCSLSCHWHVFCNYEGESTRIHITYLSFW